MLPLKFNYCIAILDALLLSHQGFGLHLLKVSFNLQIKFTKLFYQFFLLHIGLFRLKISFGVELKVLASLLKHAHLILSEAPFLHATQFKIRLIVLLL